MHSCSPFWRAPAAPCSLLHLHDRQHLNCVEIGSSDFVHTHSYADDPDLLVRVDGTSLVSCADAPGTQMLSCIDAEAHRKPQMLPSIDNMEAKRQARGCNNITAEEEMQPYMYAHSSAQEQVQTAAPCIDVYMHEPGASYREQQHVQHDLQMQGGDQYSNAEEGFVRVHSCLPPMSNTLIGCIESMRARVARYNRIWTVMQLMSTVSQIMGVLLVLGLCSSREEVRAARRSSQGSTMRSPLLVWAIGYALGCLASVPSLFCRHSQSTASPDIHLLDIGDERTTPDNRRDVERAEEEAGVARRLSRCVDVFFGIWFVLGVVWVFGRPSCAQASPNLYSLCVTLLMLSGLRYMMPIILCCALCCCLQPTTSSISMGFDKDFGKKGATQEQIDSTLPILQFKYSVSNANNVQNEKFDVSSTTILDTNTCKDVMEYCCICLKRYKEDAKLRELPCSHYFHVDCVDRWLKINASCPLCKLSIKEIQALPFSFPLKWTYARH